MVRKLLIFLVILPTLIFCSCKKGGADIASPSSSETPAIPETVSTGDYTEPILNVYNTETKTIETIPLEEYIVGVVAGEMYNDWPIEALKAQAILARTYTMYFVENKGKSKYEGADISTDISEAQAYSTSAINDNVKQAVRETRGIVLANEGEFIESWFHSNSGGTTATITEWIPNANLPEFVKIAKSPENEENSQNAVWNFSFTKSEILTALRKMNISVSNVATVEIGQKGESGRAITLNIGGKEIPAPDFRLAIGSTKMKSTFITEIHVDSNKVYLEGKGYGHGVGLSQWGAKVLADEGKTAIEICKHYYNDIDACKLYE